VSRLANWKSWKFSGRVVAAGVFGVGTGISNFHEPADVLVFPVYNAVGGALAYGFITLLAHLPGLPDLTLSQITRALGVSDAAASRMRRGLLVPHPRHWAALRSITTSELAVD
jgi:hypothetical protein